MYASIIRVVAALLLGLWLGQAWAADEDRSPSDPPMPGPQAKDAVKPPTPEPQVKATAKPPAPEAQPNDAATPPAAQPQDAENPFAAEANGTAQPPVPPECGDCCQAPSCSSWYFETGAMYLRRNRSDNIKIAEEGTGQSGPRGQRTALLTTDEIGFDEEWGPRLVLGRDLDCHRRFELIYFGKVDWEGSATVTGPDIDVPFDTDYSSDYDNAQRVRGTYVSQLHNFEANFIRRNCCSPIQTLLGFRYVDLDEGFDLESHEDDSGDTSNYQVSTENHLAGFQVGLLFERPCADECRRLRWNFDLKAGLYDNFAEQHTLMRGNNNTVVRRDFSPDDHEAALIGELGLNLIYRFNSSIAATCGYQAMWLSGVALAPEQLDFTTLPSSGSHLNNDGDLLLHGAYFGLRIIR